MKASNILSKAFFVGILLVAMSPRHSESLSSSRQNRRQHLQSALSSPILLASILLTPSNDAFASQYCASGVGDDCDSLSEGNELIRKLQIQSAANKQANEEAAREAYYMKNYPDFFQTLGKTLIKKPDGGFIAVSDAELTQLKQQNKLTTQMPKAMGGRVVDLTQKPILMLKE